MDNEAEVRTSGAGGRTQHLKWVIRGSIPPQTRFFEPRRLEDKIYQQQIETLKWAKKSNTPRNSHKFYIFTSFIPERKTMTAGAWTCDPVIHSSWLEQIFCSFCKPLNMYSLENYYLRPSEGYRLLDKRAIFCFAYK